MRQGIKRDRTEKVTKYAISLKLEKYAGEKIVSSNTWWSMKLTFENILLQYAQNPVAEKLPKEFIRTNPPPDNDLEVWSETAL